MASTHKTAKGLSQFVGSDKPTFLGDYNADMALIDELLGAADGSTKVITEGSYNIDNMRGREWEGKYSFGHRGSDLSVLGPTNSEDGLVSSPFNLEIDVLVFEDKEVTVQTFTTNTVYESEGGGLGLKPQAGQKHMRAYMKDLEGNWGWTKMKFSGVSTDAEVSKLSFELLSGWQAQGYPANRNTYQVLDFGHLKLVVWHARLTHSEGSGQSTLIAKIPSYLLPFWQQGVFSQVATCGNPLTNDFPMGLTIDGNGVVYVTLGRGSSGATVILPSDIHITAFWFSYGNQRQSGS